MDREISWYNKKCIIVSIRFLTNELRSDALDIKIFNRKCSNNLINCKFNTSTDLKYFSDNLKKNIKSQIKPFILINKLDSLITNTNHNSFSGYTSTSIAGSATNTVISSTDLGASSAPHKLQIVGTTTNTNIDNVIQVSNDNSNFYDLPSFVVSVVGTKFSGIGDICFRYFRMNTTNNTGSPITVVVEYSAKNIN